MDHCASVLLGFPSEDVLANPKDINLYENALKLHLARVESLFKEHIAAIGANAIDLLECLDPALNTLSYLALLDVLIPPASARPQEIDTAVLDTISDKMVAFLLSFDPRQVRFVGHVFSNLCVIVGSGQVVPPSIAVDVLAKAILRLDPSGSMLTSHHLTLSKLAYHTDNVAPALPVVGKNIVYYPAAGSQKDPQHLSDPSLPPPSYISRNTGLTMAVRTSTVLEYDWLVGLMYCSVRDWAAARTAFERVVAFPTRDGGVSKIMVDAHKKWVLVGLLLSGRTAAAPADAGPAAAKTFGVLGKPYLQVADHFDSLDAEALKREAEVSWPGFAEDGNEGLVREVLVAHQKWQIASFRAVYAKISIAEIRAKTKSAETGAPLESDTAVEDLVRDMIGSGMIRAAIHRGGAGGAEAGTATPSYLEFLPAADELSEAEYARAVAAAAGRIKALEPIFRATRERLGTSKEYVRYLLREQKRERDGIATMSAGAGVSAGFFSGGGSGSGGYDDPVEDEDLMTGIIALD